MTTQRTFLSFGLASALVLCSSYAFSQTSQPSGSDSTKKPDPYQMNVPKAEDKKPLVLSDQKLDTAGRMEIIRGMTAELGYARKAFPFGKTGIVMKDGKFVNPTEEQMQEIMASYGACIKVGEPAHITAVKFKDKSIIFEINGGPVRKKKWYEHIEVSGMGGAASPGQPSDDTNIHGSLVELQFDKYVPEVTPAQLKQLLDPVINFNAKSASEAYLDTVPPKAKQAIADHKALVGMNREMVTYALGRPPQKYRDKEADGTEYEEWIYGTPPQEVQFVRFVGDEVIRIEQMKVDGTKLVRTEREVVLQPQQPEVAQQQTAPGGQSQTQGQVQPASGGSASAQAPSGKPSLRRPGEDVGQQTGPGDRPVNPGANIPDMGGPPSGGDPTQPPPQ